MNLAPKLKESDSEIDWNKMDAAEIDRRYRAFLGCINVFTHWVDGSQLRLGDVVDPDLVSRLDLKNLSGYGQHHIPGLVYYHKKRHLLCVASANRTWSAFRSLTLKGRLKMSALGFSNTFIRPMTKRFKQQYNDNNYDASQIPKLAFIVGKIADNNINRIEQPAGVFIVGAHNYDQFQSFDLKKTGAQL